MQKHHTLLHDSLSTQPNKVATHHTRSDYLIQTPNTNDLTSVLLATAVIGIRSPTGHELQLRALLDNGSQASFISEFAVQQLHLRRARLQVPITGIGGCQPEFNIDCSALVLPRLGHLMPLKRVDPKPYSEFLDLPLADPNFFEPGSIDVIIGADLYGLLLRNDIKRSAINKVTAQNTHLGWVIYGRLPHTSTLLLATTFCATATTELNNLVQQLWKFNECEDVEGSSSMTQDEIYCEKLFERTVCRDLSGRYHVQYPFKESCDLAALSDSKSDALRLFAYQQARLQNNATLNGMYTAFMAEYRNLGHMEPVPSDDIAHPVCYIPHHGVYKKGSTTTKLRTVFNASRKYKGGVSLNDCLHVGPKLQSDLSSIILKWRMHRVAFIADIEKCYRQILVSRPDADMQRIVWRDEQGKPAIYRLLTVTYGLNCSPYLTIKVLHTLATDEEHDFPAASKILTESFYMDDCLHGAATVEDALNIQRQLQQLLQRGGFNLRKWMSNSTEFMGHLYTEDENLGLSRNLNLDSETNALGIYWLCDTDSIGYKTNVTPIIGDITKRQQLSDVAKIYDPPGLLAPVVVKGKAICQQLWLSGVDWDDPIPDPFQQEWRRFRAEMPQIRELKVPRWVGAEPSVSSYQLHVFSDASTVAYAAVAYLRVETSGKDVKISILTAKTKVAPLKKITIPCLELNAALLAAKVAAKVLSTLQLPAIRLYCWSDSKTTLSWIRSNPGKHKQYISNRLTQIQELTPINAWKYVPTTTNPADIASRGIFPSQLAGLSLWWRGPSWLNRHSSTWPEQHNGSTDPDEELVLSLVTIPEESKPTMLTTLLQEYSNLNKLLAVTSWCQRFLAALMKRPHETTLWCTVTERTAALQFWISKPICQKSKLLKLNPVLDDDGILRLNGRLKNANMPFYEQFPCLLPKQDPLCTLLISQAHDYTLHGGVQSTLNFIRRRYWIIDARSPIRRFIHRCIKCFRHRGVPSTQIMGSLPTHRCNAAKPFSHCGLDYGGPYQIRSAKGRGHHSYKGYVALFVCFSTRAIHLELVSDLSTAAFLAALRRFFAHRGYSSDIYSDCATTFVGADAELKADLTSFRQQLEAAARYVPTWGVTWHFIPPGSPNFGGIWEAGIKSMKHHLKRIIGSAKLTFEEFYTLLKQVEAVLNSRPISALTEDAADLAALTPGHFLVGGPLVATPEPSLLDVNPNRLKRWKQLQQMQQHFWARWSCEYLRELQVRRKWHQTSTNLAPGDLVLIRDERAPPTQWTLGRIIDVHPGTDDVVRVATIRTPTSIIKRAISKLVLLPMEDT
ncbi:uncharacterized protein LOC128855352 [Anastrepha ludens]|uniref:uncharacterized protein LOC128855352 n=2 Tax=Anastrepha ludens TaxID=28586 RepID=UPI0023B12C0E|nr:uncharacterized protein LOC128855352 [Anastrepha ludens]